LTQSRCETTCLACLAAFKGDRDQRRRLLLGPTSRCGEQILCSNLFSTRYWSSNLLADFKRRDQSKQISCRCASAKKIRPQHGAFAEHSSRKHGHRTSRRMRPLKWQRRYSPA
jgi:hypothetical protein